MDENPASPPKGSRLQRFIRNNFSPVFLYPLKGIWYFTTHRYLPPKLREKPPTLPIMMT
jgi:hypothetical protein